MSSLISSFYGFLCYWKQGLLNGLTVLIPNGYQIVTGGNCIQLKHAVTY